MNEFIYEFIKNLLNDKAFGCAAGYHAHMKHIKDLHWSSNQNIIPDI